MLVANYYPEKNCDVNPCLFLCLPKLQTLGRDRANVVFNVDPMCVFFTPPPLRLWGIVIITPQPLRLWGIVITRGGRAGSQKFSCY